MVKYALQLRNVTNVAASKTALIEVPIGPRYHYIQLQHGYASGTNTIVAALLNILQIRIKINGRIQRTFSGTELRDMNIGNGLALASNFDCDGLPNTAPGVSVPIFLAEPWLTDEKAQDALAWPTNQFTSMTIEVDLSTASTPTLVACAIVDDLQVSNVPLICKWQRQPFNAAGTSFDITTIDRKDFLRQISLYPDSGGSNAASKVTMRKDGQILRELSYSQNAALLKHYEMQPAATGRTANIYDIVLDHDGLLDSAINMNGSKDMTLTVEAASAMSGTVTAIVQRLGPPE